MGLLFTLEDDVIAQLTARLGNPEDGNMDLTGATLTSYFLKNDGTQFSIPNSQHTILNQTTDRGRYNVSLTSAQTAQFMSGTPLKYGTNVVITGKQTYLHGYDLTVLTRSILP